MELDRETTCNYCQNPSNGSQYCCEACRILDNQIGPLRLAAVNPFEHLDQPEFKNLYRQSDDKDYDFLIFCEGMHCSSCVHLVEKLPEFCPGVIEARANFGQSTVSIKLSPDGSLARAAQSISELGYVPKILSAHDNIQDKYTQENRTFLKRIAVAGFCAGNIMLFTIPIYAGLSGTWEIVFNAVGLLLFLPILFFSALPFYQGTLNALKFRTINVDLPITIAMLSGFLLSTWNFLQGAGDIYYDSTASFIFLILSARYLLKRVQQNYLAPARMQTYFQDQTYECIKDGQSTLVPWNRIRPGDTFKVKQGQTLPTDGTLMESSATIDTSLFNGESLPQVYNAGMALLGGTKLLSEAITVQSTTSFEMSQIGKLFTELDQKGYQKSHFVGLTERLAQKLIVLVFSLAGIFAFIYSFVNPLEALQRALALIVIACPCALAFGSPLTLGLALKKAQRMGILIKSANSFEKILDIQNVFFDKTGTLTEGHLSLNPTTEVPARLQEIILALEVRSQHPVAFALRKAWPHMTPAAHGVGLEEVLGQGVRGIFDGDLYEITSARTEDFTANEIVVEVTRNQEVIARLSFTDQLRGDAPAIIDTLHHRGLKTFLVSGDKTLRAQEVAAKCGIPASHAFGELSPQDKFDLLKTYSQTCMIGDGANDSLSLQQAHVGIAVKGSVDLSLQYADVYFTRGGLQPLLDLFSLAEKTRRVLIRTLSVSLLYNLIGGSAALLGYIDPMTAAILMPISSALIVLTSLWGMR